MSNTDLLRLQNQLKRSPESFVEEFQQQKRHFDSNIQIFKLQAQQDNSKTKDFASLLTFMCHVASCYKDEAAAVPDQLLDLLENNYETLDPFLRKSVVQGLLLLQNRKMVDRVKVLPVFFTLFRAADKNLRAMLFSHIVNDIKNVNKNKANHKLNTTLQNFIINMLKDENRIAAKKSLDVMVELWRRSVWNDEKTVNAISSACFSKDGKMLCAALRFFLGVTPIDDDDDNDDERTAQVQTQMQQVIVSSGTMVHVKRRGKRQPELKRAVKGLKSIEKGKDKGTKISVTAIQLLYDPQQFVERLFSSVKGSSHSMDVRMLMMNVISRVVGYHKLILFNFYPFLQKYIQPHQKNVTMILTFLAQSSHELVDPDVIQPCIKTLANHFVTDRSSPEVMAVGINAIREVCSRCPLAMTRDLLVDLAQYKKSKEKGIMMASRSLIALFRNLNPMMLTKKDRGKAASLCLQAGQLFKGDLEYGAVQRVADLPGVELLAGDGGEFAEGENAWEVEEKEVDSDEEDFEGWEEEEEMEAEDGNLDFLEGMEDDDEGAEGAEGDEVEGVAMEQDEDEDGEGDDEEEEEAPALVKADAAPAAPAVPLAASRIFTPKDFERLNKLRAEHDKEMKTRGKRTREDGSTLLKHMGGDAVDEENIVGWVKRKKMTKEERMASIHEGRNGRDKFGKPKEKGGGSTNETKKRAKPFMLTKNSKTQSRKKNLGMHGEAKALTKHLKNLKSQKKNKRAGKKSR